MDSLFSPAAAIVLVYKEVFARRLRKAFALLGLC